MNPQIIRYAAAAGIGLVVGGVGGYIVGVARTRKTFLTIAEQEIQSVHNHYANERNELFRLRQERYKTETVLSEEELAKVNTTNESSGVVITDVHLSELEGQDGISIEGKLLEEVTLEDIRAAMAERTVGDFAVAQDEVGEEIVHPFQAAQAEADRKRPFHISIEQWAEDDEGANHDKIALIYFEKDDILTTESHITIDDIDGTIGIENLAKFGSNSDDKNIVYVRDLSEAIDYEVTRRASSYQVEILKMTPEEAGLAEPRRKIGRMRDDG